MDFQKSMNLNEDFQKSINLNLNVNIQKSMNLNVLSEYSMHVNCFKLKLIAKPAINLYNWFMIHTANTFHKIFQANRSVVMAKVAL